MYSIGQRILIQLWRDTKTGYIVDVVHFENGHVTSMTDEDAHNRGCFGEFTLDDGTLYTGDLYRYKSDDSHTWGWLQPHEIQPMLT